MMLNYLGWHEAEQLIYTGLEAALGAKRVTYDLERLMKNATKLSTCDFADAIIVGME